MQMRSKMLAAVVGLAMVLAFGSGDAQAGPVVVAGDSVKFADGPGTTGGGEFTVTVNNSWAFITFCLQRTEYVDFANTFHVDSVNPYTLTDPAANGGDAMGRDHISAQTAYLYTMFRDGALTGYSYAAGPSRVSSANDLQRAFWMFEQELAMNATNPFVILANNAVNSGAWSGIGNVRVLNLSRRGVEAQDQLTLVPEPASMLLLVGGLGTVLARRRRARGQAVGAR
jgi:hypothetical protein